MCSIFKAFQITPSVASPGRSIIVKKEDGLKSAPNLFLASESDSAASGRKNIRGLLMGDESHEITKIKELEQMGFVNSAVKLSVPKPEGKIAKNMSKKQLQKISGKTRLVSGRRKLQVCLFRCLFSIQLTYAISC